MHIVGNDFSDFDTKPKNGILDKKEAEQAYNSGCVWANEGQDENAFNLARLEYRRNSLNYLNEILSQIKLIEDNIPIIVKYAGNESHETLKRMIAGNKSVNPNEGLDSYF